jgi:uncharacterized membrane protein YjgN (DUF898 family)
MDEQVVVICPHCGFSRSVAKGVIPLGTTQATCPKCKQSFALQAEALVPRSEPTPQPAGMNPPPEPPADYAAAPANPFPMRPRNLRFVFHGTAGEYFGIWIVNALLKLVTLGCYSAWAKVRQRRFFYGNATLHGEPFEYTADPWALFKGWLIGAGAFLLYMIGGSLSPVLGILIGLILFLLIPWLVVRSRMFNTRNSSFRNIRFSFRPDYRQAYLIFAGLPLLTAFTLGLLAPYLFYRQQKFLVENCSYGATPFVFSATAMDYYKLFLKVVLVFLLLVGVVTALVFAFGSADMVGVARTAGNTKARLGALGIAPMVCFAIIYFFLGTYLQAALANLTWNATTVGGNLFRSTLRTRDMIWIYFSNLLAIACSFGLLIPWAKVRMACYRFERLSLKTTTGLDSFVAAAKSLEVGAAGEEIGDIFGVSVDLGL